jgi:hypothetical protein
MWYGDQAIEFIHAHSKTVGLAAVGLLAAAFVGYVLYTKARASKGR